MFWEAEWPGKNLGDKLTLLGERGQPGERKPKARAVVRGLGWPYRRAAGDSVGCKETTHLLSGLPF